MFFRKIDGDTFSYPVPKGKKKEDEILDCYVSNCRKAFKLTKKDGVTDKEFFDRA